MHQNPGERDPAAPIQRGPSGHRRGEAHGRARHSDAVVERARALRANGRPYSAIAGELGVSLWTVRDWITFRSR